MNPFTEETTEPQQGTPEWHAARKAGIGGSEIAVVLGISPYKTRYQLWLEKSGLVQPVDISNLPHVQRGVLAEPIARKKFEDQWNIKLTPRTWPQTGIARCSDDGSSLDHKIMIECKAMGREAHQNALLGKIPDYYLPQCIWNLGVSGLEKCYFISVYPESDYDMAIIEVKPDPIRFAGMLEEAHKFWDLVTSKTPPEFSDKDCVEITNDLFRADAEEYIQTKELIKGLEAKLERYENALIANLGDKASIQGFGLKITRYSKAGAVVFKDIPELKGVDLEPYRKAPSLCTRITVEKK